MTLGELFAPMRVEDRLTDVKISDIVRHVDRVTRGSVFVCTKGQYHDGHDHAARALEMGAAAVVTEIDLGFENQIIVKSASHAYALLSAAFFRHPAKKLRLIGVTGTNGKTTATHMIRYCLEAAGRTCGIIGTIDYRAGGRVYVANNTTPDAFELHRLFADMVAEGCEFAVMEVSSHALEQGRVYGLSFEAAVFTNLTQDHLDYHGTMENYFAAKRLLFEQTALAIVNAEDDAGRRIAVGLPCRTVAYTRDARQSSYSAKKIVPGAGGIAFELYTPAGMYPIRLPVPGRFSVSNALAAVACCFELGIPPLTVCRAISEFTGVRGRLEVVPTGRNFTVIIDYAHTPDGLEKVLEAIGESASGRVTALFGCGGDRDRTKRPLMAQAVVKRADWAVVTSDNPRTEDPAGIIDEILTGMRGCPIPYTVIASREDAIRYAVRTAQPGDVVLLAGKGHETYQVLKNGTIYFDEREVVADALRKLDM